jgi:uncharacterized phage-like protein YoqJ
MRVMVTAHRPPHLGGYQTPNPTEQWVRDNLRVVLGGLQGREPELVGVTGMALGGDQIFADICIELGIPFIAVVPFKGQESRWPEASQARYNALLRKAKKVVIVDEIPSYHSDKFGGKMALRNKWMVDHSDQALAVWDGSEGGTGNAVTFLRKKGRKILRLDPAARTVGLDVVSRPEDIDEGPDVFDMFGE